MKPFDGNCKNLQKLSRAFLCFSTISEIFKFQICDLQEVGQGHGVQYFTMMAFDGKYQNQLEPFHAFLR